MSGAFELAARHAWHHAGRTLMLIVCVGLSMFVPLATRVIFWRFQEELTFRAASTPLVAGARASRFDLVMTSLYFRISGLPTVTMGDWSKLSESGLAEAVPVHVRFTARSEPIVATTPEYFERRGLTASKGRLPAGLGEVVLGAGAARRVGVGVGEELFSDQRELYDISKPPALAMSVVGVLGRMGTVDDDAVFVDINTAWILEGLSHGHVAPEAGIPEQLVLDRTGGNVAISESLVDYNRVTPANAHTFHVHAERSELPISAVLLFPSSEKSASILKSRVNARDRVQIVSPREAVGELIGHVLKVKSAIDAVAIVLALSTVGLIGVVMGLSLKVRAREFETLQRIGVSRGTVRMMVVAELVIVLVVGSTLAGAGVAAAWPLAPHLVKLL